MFAKQFLHILFILSFFSGYCQSNDYDALLRRAKAIDSIHYQGISEGPIKTNDGLGEGGFSDYSTIVDHKIIKILSEETIHYGYGKIDTPNTQLIRTEYYYNNDSVFLIRERVEYYDTLRHYFGGIDEFYIFSNSIPNIYMSKDRKTHYESLLKNSTEHFRSCKAFEEEQK